MSWPGCATPASGDPESDRSPGVAAYDKGDYPTAYRNGPSSIDDEDLAAMRNVAMMLRASGTGVAKDPKKAEELYEMAAEAGLPTAQADLADMLLKGEAGPPDPAAALPLLAPPRPPPTTPSPNMSWLRCTKPAAGRPGAPGHENRPPALCRGGQPWHEGSPSQT